MMMTKLYAVLLTMSAVCCARSSTVQVHDVAHQGQLDSEDHKVELQRELLLLLGINEPPQLSRHTVVPAYMMNLYNRMSGELPDNDEWPVLTNDKMALKATSIRGFLAQRGRDMMRSSLTQRFTFLFANVSKSDVVLHAKLTMLWKPFEARGNNNLTDVVVNVYQFTKEDESDAELAHQRKLSFQSRHQPQWLHFNVGQKVKDKLLVNAGDPIRFLVKVYLVGNKTIQLHPQDIGLSTYHVAQREQPLLVLYVHSNRGRFRRQAHERRESIFDIAAKLTETRHRRNAVSRQEEFNPMDQTGLVGSALPSSPSIDDLAGPTTQQKRICHRRQMVVNFREMGWHWIIAPKLYKAYSCRGECKFPLPHKSVMNKTNHAVVQTILYHMDAAVIPKVVCSPWSFKDLTLLFSKSDHEVQYTRYTDMVVTQCGCR